MTVAATDPMACPVTMDAQASKRPEWIIAGMISIDVTAGKAMLAPKLPIRTAPPPSAASCCALAPAPWAGLPRAVQVLAHWHLRGQIGVCALQP